MQVDSIRYVFDLTDEERRQQWQQSGVDSDAAIDELIRADNATVARISRGECVFGLHMCRGNNRSNYFAEGSYERVAEKAFSSLDYGRFLLEYDTDRAGDFSPLRFVPQCGFASVLQGNVIEWDDQRRKLELLVSTARRMWGS